MERSGPLVRRPFIRIWLWLTLVTSCAVFIEPAICDLLIVGLFGVAFAMGLRIPRGLSIAVLLAGIFLLGNLVASALTVDPAGSLAPVAIRTYLILAWWLLLTCLIYEDQEFAYRYLWSGFSIAAVIAAGLGALAFFGIIPDYGRLVTDGRVTSLFKDANVYGPFLVPPAIYALYRIENASPSTAILYFAIYTGILTRKLAKLRCRTYLLLCNTRTQSTFCRRKTPTHFCRRDCSRSRCRIANGRSQHRTGAKHAGNTG